MVERPTLLGIFAHPDDESFGPGGTLARYAAEGADVHVIIATDGDAGSVDTQDRLKEGTNLASVRAAEELSSAAVALGITTIWSLPYRDSGMRGSPDNGNPRALIQQPLEVLTGELVDHIRRLRPQVIITHDPLGGYGHPDHIRVCQATTAAFHVASDPNYGANGHGLVPYRPQKLYYTAFDRRLMRLAVYLMPLLGQDPTAIGRNRDINLVEISRWEMPVHTRIDVRPYLAIKEAASRAHASQYSGGPAYLRILPGFLRQHMVGIESFTRAHPVPSKEVETDLFSGVQLA
jgi:mycothiol S-conjugate amidase